jgi:hypothetical protein
VFRDKHFEVRVQKDPPSMDELLKEPMSIERKIEIVKEVGYFGARMYIFCKIVDTCSTLIVNAAWKGIK